MKNIEWASAVLLCLAVACGGSEEPAERQSPSPPEPDLAAAETDAPDSCPEGTAPGYLEIEAADTVLRWCDKPGSKGARVQHGPWRKERGGLVVERGGFQEGERHGRWTLSWSSGAPQSEGEYRFGERVGTWTFWREDGSEIQRTEYGGDPVAPVAQVVWAPGADEPEAAQESAAAPDAVTIRFENGGGEELTVAIEPSAEEWAVPPGTSVEVQARGEGAADVVVEATDGGIVIWAGDETETVSSSGDEELPAAAGP